MELPGSFLTVNEVQLRVVTRSREYSENEEADKLVTEDLATSFLAQNYGEWLHRQMDAR